LIDKRTEPKYSIGAKLHDPADKDKDTFPGPNMYSIPSKVVEKPGKTMGIKLKGSLDSGNTLAPGPGTYDGEKFKKDNY